MTRVFFLHGGLGKSTRARQLVKDGGRVFEGDPGLAAVKDACASNPVIVVCSNVPPSREWEQATFGRRATVSFEELP